MNTLIKQYHLEKLSEELYNYLSNHSPREEIIATGIEILKEAYQQITKHRVLANHIAQNTEYPMTLYKKKVTVLFLEKTDSFEYKRTIYTYTSKENTENQIQIFEQNWFVGYGIYVENIGWVGILEDE